MSTVLLRLGRGCPVPARPRRLSPSLSVARSEVGGGQAVPCEAGVSPPGWCSSFIPAEHCFCSVVLIKSCLGTPAKQSFV